MNLIVSNLKDRPDLFNPTMDLIEASFHYQFPNKFEIDFHPLVSPRNLENCHIILNESDKVIGHIGFIKKNLVIQNELIPIIFVGGVCIDQKFQGQGLAQKYFKDLINQYKTACALLVLWSDLNHFFEKLGFYECGEIFQTGSNNIDDSSLHNYIPRDWSSLSDIELTKIEAMRIKTYPDSLFLKRDDSDWKDIKGIRSAKLFLNDQSYFIINKGQDLDGVIHEFGSFETKQFIHRFQEFPLWVYGSKLYVPKFHQKIFLGLFSIGEPTLLRKLISEVSNGEITDLIVKPSGMVCFKHNGFNQEMSSQNFLQSIWGPHKIIEFSNYKPIIISGLESV